MTVSSLGKALESNQGSIEQYLTRYVEPTRNGFTAVSTAFLKDGAVIILPENTQDIPPIHVMFITSKRQNSFVTYPRLLMVIGKNSTATLVESYLSLTQNKYFTNGVSEIVVQEGAQIDHFRLMQESAQAYHVTTTQVDQHKDSVFNSTSFLSLIHI